MSTNTTRAEESSTALTLSYDEYDRMVECGAFNHLPGKIELLRGKISRMNPAGPLHDGLIIYLTTWSGRVVDYDKVMVTAQTGLDLRGLRSRPEPDLMWVRKGQYHSHHPTAADVKLAIEVSYSSLKKDLTDKAELYAEAGIGEYWLVDAVSSCVHAFREPHPNGYKKRSIANVGETLSPVCQPDAVLNVSELFGT
jgi:Uma2 family endonuclease